MPEPRTPGRRATPAAGPGATAHLQALEQGQALTPADRWGAGRWRWALVPLVLALHLGLLGRLADGRAGAGHAADGLAPIEVAFVRDLAQAAPPTGLADDPGASPAPPPAPRLAAVAEAQDAPRPPPAASAPEPAQAAASDPPGRVLAEALPPPVPEAPPPPPAPDSPAPTAPPPEPTPAVTAPVPPPVAAAVPPVAPPASAAATLAVAAAPAGMTVAVGSASAAAAPAGVRTAWPPSTRLSYRLQGHYRGPVEGSARVDWVRRGNRYQVRMESAAGPLFSRRVTSDGELGPQGLQPQRFAGEQKVLFGSPRRWSLAFGPERVTLVDERQVDTLPGVQDEASQFVQLTWLFTTQPERLQVGRSVEFPLALTRRLDRWTFDVVAEETLHLPHPLGPVQAFHIKPRREAGDGDMTAEMWVAPTLQYLPVRILIRQREHWVDLQLERPPQQAVEAHAPS